MNYIVMIADHDYGNISLIHNGNRYDIEVYISGWGVKKRETFTDYNEAETRYLEMCKNSHIEPVKVEHDPWVLMTNVD